MVGESACKWDIAAATAGEDCWGRARRRANWHGHVEGGGECGEIGRQSIGSKE